MYSSELLLIAMALILGIRHGFDLDHLATIDALTRGASQRPGLAKLTGVLFSLGHGAVVVGVSILIGSGLMSGVIPNWFEGLGMIISIACLFLFGALTLWSVFYRNTDHDLPLGIKSYLIRNLSIGRIGPGLIILLGCMFALSFDTLSQAALFSLSGSAVSGAFFSAVLGLSFMLGMMFADGINGWLLSCLLIKANRDSLFWSRALGVMIAFFSLGLGVLGIMRMS